MYSSIKILAFRERLLQSELTGGDVKNTWILYMLTFTAYSNTYTTHTGTVRAHIITLSSVCLTSSTAYTANVWSPPSAGVRKDSALGTAIRYGLDGPRIKLRWGKDFSRPSRPIIGLTQPPVQWIPGLFPRGRAGVALIPFRAIALLPLWSFMARSRMNFTLPSPGPRVRTPFGYVRLSCHSALAFCPAFAFVKWAVLHDRRFYWSRITGLNWWTYESRQNIQSLIN